MKRRDLLKGLAVLAAVEPALANGHTSEAAPPEVFESGYATTAWLEARGGPVATIRRRFTLDDTGWRGDLDIEEAAREILIDRLRADPAIRARLEQRILDRLG